MIFHLFHRNKLESDKRRKQLETLVAELQLRLQESGKSNAENAEKLSRLMFEMEQSNAALSEAENRAILAVKTAESLKAQLAESSLLLDDETSLKLAFISKLKNAESQLTKLQEQMEDEEESKLILERELAAIKLQLVDAKKKSEEDNVTVILV